MSISKDEKFRELLKNTLHSFADVDDRLFQQRLINRLFSISYRNRFKKFNKDINELLDYIDNYVERKENNEH